MTRSGIRREPDAISANGQLDRGNLADRRNRPDERGPFAAGAAFDQKRSRSRKAQLLADSVRQFCSLDRPERADIDAFKELFYEFIDSCDKGDRRTISAAIARTPFCPRTVLIYLAMDDPDIAAPILLFSTAINEADILTLARKLSLEHLKIMCRRIDLTTEAAKALAHYGGAECRELLARNAGLESKRNAAADRPKKPQPVGLRMPASDSHATVPQTRETIRKNASIRPAPDDRNSGKGAQLREEMMGLAARGGKLGRKPEPAQAPATIALDRDQPLERQMLEAVRNGGVPALIDLVSQHSSIPAEMLRKITQSGGIEGFGVLFKGLEIGYVASLQLLLLVDRETGASRANYDAAKSLLRRLDMRECRDFLIEIGARLDRRGAADETPVATGKWSRATEARRRALRAEDETPRLPTRPGLRRAG